jgi:ribonuclease HI
VQDVEGSGPFKTESFLWRLAKQSLPTADLLHHRNMSTTPRCTLCGAVDSWRHSLLECAMARSVWALGDEELVEHLFGVNEPSAKGWIFSLIDSLSHEVFVKVLVTLWAIWSARRKAIHEEIFQSPLSTNLFIQSYLLDLKQLEKPKPQAGFLTPRRNTGTWLAPPPGVHKFMVDAAESRTGNQGAVGVICRNSDGLYIGASACVYPGIIDSAVLETMACREALSLADDLLVRKISISSDCEGILRDISEGTGGKNAAIVREIKERVGYFEFVRFVHEGRNYNLEAHSLARASSSLELGRRVWLLNTPDLVPIPVSLSNIIHQ